MNITSILIALLVALHISMAEASKGQTRNMIQKEKEKVKKPKKPKKCKIAEMYISDGSRLGNIIASLIEEQDFASYCNEVDFNAATEWFLNADNHTPDLLTDDDEYMKERLILALTYSANCKDGCTLPTDEDNWMSATNHCNWAGVICNDLNKVSKLDMSRSGLTGDYTMFGMQSLEVLDLTSNDLSSTFTVAGESANANRLTLDHNNLSSFFGGEMLPSLKFLYLTFNDFTGDFIITSKDFPTSIQYLNLGSNMISGFFGGDILTSLKSLGLSSNDFVGDFAITSKDFPTSLQFLHLHGNKLTGFRDGVMLTNLQSLYLSNNDFVGDFVITPKDFPTSLEKLYLHENMLTGFIDGSILENLDTLALYDNAFVDDFVIDPKDFPTSIQYLYLGRNVLTGFVGGEILTKLEYLSLSSNNFVGDFSITSKDFPAFIRSLALDNNMLTGFVDSGKILTNLEYLELTSNKFTGELHLEADDYPSSLTTLILNKNSGLTKIDAEENAVPFLSSLQLHDIEGIKVGYELCYRSGYGSLEIFPSLCNWLRLIIASFLKEQDFQKYGPLASLT
ncbi:hypothetical protein CTEN210_09098 [Chaetoceros tenuissimus]|uniref:Leucine-rich repeat-containing N-terminal plant-type domain-containing protein n=1 Tax=Chaetoceros tenuissimus TaxID=426638 RepID=A0AAD3H6P3_9STRA|nr:hypothetical protein CTEN210_09098 [Chaetoceros tenuissimus]